MKRFGCIGFAVIASGDVEKTKERTNAEAKESFATRANDYLRRYQELTPQSSSPSFLSVVIEYSPTVKDNSTTPQLCDGFLGAAF